MLNCLALFCACASLGAGAAPPSDGGAPAPATAVANDGAAAETRVGAAAAPVPIADENTFGQDGQFFLRADSSAGANFVHPFAGARAADQWSVSLRPSLGYFFSQYGYVAASLSLAAEGLELAGSQASSTGSSVGVGAAVGARLALAHRLHLVPSIGIEVAHTGVTTTAADGLRREVGGRTSIDLSLSAPLLIEWVPHLGIGVGPSLAVDVFATGQGADSPRATHAALNVSFVAWI